MESDKLTTKPGDVENSASPKILETTDERRVRLMSLNIMYFTMFLMTLGFSIILTGVWPYLDKLDPGAGKNFLGYIVAANPLAQMIFSPLFGWWANKVSSIRIPFLVSLIIFCIASTLYSSLEHIENNARYWMLIARFLVGVSSANVVICRSYLSAATTLEERTKSMSILTLAQTLGFIAGPAFQGAFTPLETDGFLFMKVFHVNMYTAPGWLNVFLGIINILLFMPFAFQDKRIAAREQMLILGKESEKETWKAIKPDYLVSWTMIVSLFVFVFNFVLLECLGTVLTMEQFAWTKSEALEKIAILMAVGGLIACLTFFMISPLCKKFKESHVLIVGGFFLMVLGRIAHIPYGTEIAQLAEDRSFSYPNGTEGFYDENDPRLLGCPKSQEWCKTTPVLGFPEFIIGYLLTSVGYPIGLTLIQTIFSKVLGPRPQGVWQGLLTSSGCLSRIFGPIAVATVYARFGTFWLSLSTAIMMIIPMTVLILLRDRLYIQNSSKTVEMRDLSKKDDVNLINAKSVMSNGTSRNESESLVNKTSS